MVSNKIKKTARAEKKQFPTVYEKTLPALIIFMAILVFGLIIFAALVGAGVF